MLERPAGTAAVELTLPPTPAAKRAQLLARLGLGSEAGEELAEAQVATARSVLDGLGFSLDFIDTMTTNASVLVDSSEVAA